jgi:hypothetical protein
MILPREEQAESFEGKVIPNPCNRHIRDNPQSARPRNSAQREQVCQVSLVRVARTCSVRDAVTHESRPRNNRYTFVRCDLVGEL